MCITFQRYFDAARSYGRAEEFLSSWIASKGHVRAPSGPDAIVTGSKWGYTYMASELQVLEYTNSFFGFCKHWMLRCWELLGGGMMTVWSNKLRENVQCLCVPKIHRLASGHWREATWSQGTLSVKPSQTGELTLHHTEGHYYYYYYYVPFCPSLRAD